MRNSPPGISTRSLWLIFEKGKLKFALCRVYAIERDPHPITDRELAAGALADHLAHVLVISVLVARERVDGHEALDEQVRQFHEHAVFGRGDDERVEHRS